MTSLLIRPSNAVDHLELTWKQQQKKNVFREHENKNSHIHPCFLHIIAQEHCDYWSVSVSSNPLKLIAPAIIPPVPMIITAGVEM